MSLKEKMEAAVRWSLTREASAKQLETLIEKSATIAAKNKMTSRDYRMAAVVEQLVTDLQKQVTEMGGPKDLVRLQLRICHKNCRARDVHISSSQICAPCVLFKFKTYGIHGRQNLAGLTLLQSSRAHSIPIEVISLESYGNKIYLTDTSQSFYTYSDVLNHAENELNTALLHAVGLVVNRKERGLSFVRQICDTSAYDRHPK